MELGRRKAVAGNYYVFASSHHGHYGHEWVTTAMWSLPGALWIARVIGEQVWGARRLGETIQFISRGDVYHSMLILLIVWTL